MGNLLLATSIESAVNELSRRVNEIVHKAETGYALGIISIILILLTMLFRFAIRSGMREDYNEKISKLNKMLKQQNENLNQQISDLQTEYRQVVEDLRITKDDEIKRLKEENLVLGLKLDNLKETTYLMLNKEGKKTKK